MNAPLWQLVTLYHLTPSILRVIVSLAIIFAVIKVFKIKNPAIKSILYLLPLIKGYLGLLLGTGNISHEYGPVFLNIDTIFSKSDIIYLFSGAKIDIFFWAVIVGITIAVVINTIRWTKAYLFYKSLSYEQKATRELTPDIFKVLDKLVPLYGVKYPEVIICHKKYATPVMIGTRKPKIIFSANLVEVLSKQDLSLIIAHELAHLKRKDYVLHWFTVILRDCLFFNPVAHFVYRKIETEKEKAADILAVKILGLRNVNLAETLSKVNYFLMQQRVGDLPLGSTGIVTSKKECRNKQIYERVQFLLKSNTLNKNNLIKYSCAFSICFFVLIFELCLTLPVAQRFFIFY